MSREIELGALQYASSAYFGKDPTVVLGVFQMPGSNALDLQSRVKAKMDELATRFPKGIAYAMHYDTTRFVSASMHDVLMTLGEALLLVVAGRVRVPAELAHDDHPDHRHSRLAHRTLAVMHAFGFSLNMLSLLGMVLAIGLVVDDAIVVVENVERQLEAGLKPLAATARRHARGDGTDHRDDGRADGRVHPGRLHSRRRGAALQPVRAHGGDLGRHLGLQLADAEPGAQRAPSCGIAADRPSRRSAGSTAASMALARLCTRRRRTLIRWR